MRRFIIFEEKQFCIRPLRRQAISNIYKLLKPDGTCLLAFLVSNPIFDIYLDLSRMKKYSKYMTDVRRFISPYHFEEKPLEVFSEKLFDVGFKIFHIEIRDQVFIYNDLELLKCKYLSLIDEIFFVETSFHFRFGKGSQSIHWANA